MSNNEQYSRDGTVCKEDNSHSDVSREGIKKPLYTLTLLILWIIGTLAAGVYGVLSQQGWVVVPLVIQLVVGCDVYVESTARNCFRNQIIFLLIDIAALIGLYWLSGLFPLPFQAISKKWLIHLAEQLFFVVGYLLIVISFYYRNSIMKRCTTPVRAVCCKVNSRNISSYRGNNAKGYAPEFTFYYNGRSYRVEDRDYTRHSRPQLHQEYQIFIDPQSPEHFYEPKKYHAIKTNSFVYGSCIIVLGLIMNYLTVFTTIRAL